MNFKAIALEIVEDWQYSGHSPEHSFSRHIMVSDIVHAIEDAYERGKLDAITEKEDEKC